MQAGSLAFAVANNSQGLAVCRAAAVVATNSRVRIGHGLGEQFLEHRCLVGGERFYRPRGDRCTVVAVFGG